MIWKNKKNKIKYKLAIASHKQSIHKDCRSIKQDVINLCFLKGELIGTFQRNLSIKIAKMATVDILYTGAENVELLASHL